MQLLDLIARIGCQTLNLVLEALYLFHEFLHCSFELLLSSIGLLAGLLKSCLKLGNLLLELLTFSVLILKLVIE